MNEDGGVSDAIFCITDSLPFRAPPLVLGCDGSLLGDFLAHPALAARSHFVP
jgi:hypothetical protein